MPVATENPPRVRKKPGPKPKGVERCNLTLTPDLLDWAMSQPEGASALVRRLLAQERDRRQPAATGD